MKSRQVKRCTPNKGYNIVLIHGWLSTPHHHWFPWLKFKLKSMGNKVVTPFMPNPVKPDKDKWLLKLSKTLKNKDAAKTILVAHSLGVPTVLFFLSNYKGPQFAHVILVSGFARKIKYLDMITTGYEMKFNWNKIVSKSQLWTVIHGDKDPLVPISEAKWLAKQLKIKPIIEKNKGHFTQYRGVFKLEDVFLSITRGEGFDIKTKESLKFAINKKIKLQKVMDEIWKFIK